MKLALAIGLTTLLAPLSAMAEEPVEDEDEPAYVVVDPAVAPEPEPEGPPSSGVGFLVPGGVLTGLGVVNLATAPLCKTDLVDRSAQDGCLIASLVVGGTFLAVGVPLLAVGGVKRAHYKRWRDRHRQGEWPSIGLAPLPQGAWLTYAATF